MSSNRTITFAINHNKELQKVASIKAVRGLSGMGWREEKDSEKG